MVRATAVVVVVLAAVLLVIHFRHHPVAPVQLAGKVSDHGTHTATTGATVTMQLEETAFSPTFVVSSPGAHLTIELHDQGFHAHTFTVPSLGIDLTLAPNSTTAVPITLPASGVVPFYCRF